MSDQFHEEQLLVSFVKKSLEKQDIKNVSVTVTGTSEKGEGYLSDVVFVTVNGTKKSDESDTELHLVLKVSKFLTPEFETLRKLYERELFIYDNVFPEYRKFEESKYIKYVFDSIPKCIATLETDGRYIVVLKNLRQEGYVQHDRFVPMNINHMQLVLKNYAKFHAIGFAFKDQQRQQYESLTKDYANKYNLIQELLEGAEIGATKIRDNVKTVDAELAYKINDLIENGILSHMSTLIDEVIEDSVIVHADCWNSNFLFKYNEDDKENPTDVVILDWQLSNLLSPTTDLAYFMFMVSSKEQVAQFDNLLRYYYDYLHQYITELGSDPEQLYAYSKFRDHWKKFSFTGLVFVFAYLELVLVDPSEIVDYDTFKDLEEMKNAVNYTKPQNHELFLDRVVSVFRYYFDLIES